MSDHKWARMKRAFGAKPSNELINGRVNKIADELGKLQVPLSQLAFAGLDGGEIARRRQALADRREQALKLPDAAQRYAALDGIKADARQLVAEAPGIVKTLTDTLAKDLDSARNPVVEAVNKAKALKNPVIINAVAPVLRVVDDAMADADRLPTEKDRLDEFSAIDIGPLTTLLGQVGSIESQLGFSAGRMRKSRELLDRMPAGADKIRLTGDADTLDTRLTNLANAAGVEDLRTKSKEVYDDLAKLMKALSDLVGEYEALASAREDVAIIVGPAKAVKSVIGKAILDEALGKVEDLVSDAEEQPTVREIKDALRTKELAKLLRELAMLTADARDLDQNLPRLLSGIDAVIKKVPGDKDRTDFEQELTALSLQADQMNTETDLATAKAGYARLRRLGEELMDRILPKSGDEGLTEALSARYGVTVSGNENAKINLMGTYEALEAVPPSHVDHEKIKQVIFTGTENKGAAYGASKITIDNFTDSDLYTYEVGGKPLKVNGFNVCMLHEIGHAVDDKHRVMSGSMETGGAGDWKSENANDVRTAIVNAALAEMKNPAQPVKDFTVTMIDNAMSNKETAKPTAPAISKAEWKVLEKYAEKTRSMTNGAEPWFVGSPADRAIGARVYTQNNASWFSYSLAERQANGIRNYQWRSPDEWFADLYAVAWLTNRPLGKGTPDAVARWLPA